MAINVDDVYKTVLYILNKEQRGYLTPEEFNKIATQVQLEIFEQYFEDLNKYSRVQDNNTEYGNRIDNIEEKLDIFKSRDECVWSSSSGCFFPPAPLPVSGSAVEFYKLGTVMYNDIEVERVKPNELLYINKSPLTKPTKTYPICTYEDGKIYVYPKTIVGTPLTSTAFATTPISATFIRKPRDVRWGYKLGTLQEFEYDDGHYVPNVSPGTEDSRNFELHPSEQSEVVLNILMYAGVVIRDPQIVQVASKKIKEDEMSEKS